MKTKVILTSTLLAASLAMSFDLKGFAKDMVEKKVEEVKNPSSTSSSKSLSNLSEDTVSKGIKEALNKGVDYAVSSLGAKDGYLKNAKIPLPSNLSKMEKAIRKAGGGKYADQLVKSMNDAATDAAPKTAKVFADSISKMSIDDAKKILAGDDKAATNYFKSNSFDELKKVISPIVNTSIEKNKVSKYYDQVNGYYKQYGAKYLENSSIMGYAKQFGADKYIPSASDKSLNDHVTNSAIAGLFTMIAKKEKEIRSKPSSQTTSLLKKVFGD